MAVEVHGLTPLIRAFRDVEEAQKEEFVWELEEVANPVRQAAQAKAPGSMSNMVHTREWGAMRVGITRRNPASVYVVPQLRGRRRTTAQGTKDSFTSRMQSAALDPALKENQEKVLKRAEDFLDRIGRKEGF